MHVLEISMAVLWGLFWLYWLLSAIGVKQGTRSSPLRGRFPGLLFVAAAVVVLRAFRADSLVIHEPIVRVLGAILFLAGLGLAIWARIHLGRNWGMPMTQKEEPELVTSGPYRLVRHPIYSGILLGVIGTALATDVYLLFLALVMGAHFIYSARAEERMLTASFPADYERYRASTKMLIPFLL